MKEYNITKKAKSHLSFWIVMLLCTAMIGVSCWFAYTQTSKELTMELDSVLGDAPAETKLTLPAVTIPVQTTAQAVAAPPVVPVTMPAQTTAAATRPAAEIFAPSQTTVQTTTAETETETVPPTIPSRYPVEGTMIQPFSGGELVKSATTGVWQTHNGIDIAASLGDEVYAMDTGIVESVEEDPLWGVCVTIDHRNGIFSRYCNLNAGVTVTAGDQVTNHTVIGAVGDTADVESALETHLHFELLQGDKYIDPVDYIEG